MKAKTTIRPFYGLLCLLYIAMNTLFITGCTEEELITPNIITPSSAVGDDVSITNPGFESSKTGWSGSFAISGDEHTGSQAAKTSGSSNSFEQTVSVSSNTNYTLTAYVLGDGNIGAVVGSNSEEAGGDYSSYTQVTVTFNSGSNTSVTIYGEYGGDEARFDDFELIEASGSTSNSGNLASGGTASQSSNYSSTLGLAGLAIDGNTNGNWSTGSVTHTQSGSDQWWKVDIGSTQPIGDIILYNRTAKF